MIILCGIDFSPASHDALISAAAWARAGGARRLILAHVAATDRNDAQLATAQASLDAMATEVAGAATDVQTLVIVGDAPSTLASLADTEGANLIVVASKGTTNAPLYKLGGTSEQLAIAANVPVLIVRDAAPMTAWADGTKPLRALLGVDEDSTCDVAAHVLWGLRQRRPIDLVLGAIYYADVAARHYGLPSTNAVDADPEVERLVARDLRRRFAASTGLGTTEVRPRRGLGRIADHLIELAEAERADMIVVGTSRTSGLGRLGSVSAGVVHEAPLSILCIPPSVVAESTVPELRCALVASDLSEFAARAVPLAFAAVASAGAEGEVHLVTVVGGREAADPAQAASLHEQLRRLVPRGARARVETHVVRGDDPASALAEAAARFGADIVCIASHGRSGIGRALMGSVADRLLRATRIPVLVSRPKVEGS